MGCTNLRPGFECGPCPPGYHGIHHEGFKYTSGIDTNFIKQQCDDIDECLEKTANCGKNTRCINRPGSYRCECNSGYIHNASNTFEFECISTVGMCKDGTVCDKNAGCVNIGGGNYTCKCKVGFAGPGIFCGPE